MFNFFKKSKSKDNSSSKANNKNKKGKQTVKNNNSKQEKESNDEDLKSSKICESVVGLVEAMGNTESKSQTASPGLNKIGGNESQDQSATAPVLDSEFSQVDRNSNGIDKTDKNSNLERGGYSPISTKRSPTVSDLLCGVGYEQIASDPDRIASNSDKSASNSDQIASKFDQSASYSDQSASSSDKIALNSNKIDSKFDQTASESYQTATKSDQSAPNSYRIASNSDRVMSSSDQSTSTFDQISSNYDKSASNFDRIPSNYKQSALNNDQISTNSDQNSCNSDQNSNNSDQYSTNSDQIASNLDNNLSNSDQMAFNDRSKKESTPDSDVIFKTAPSTPILNRDTSTIKTNRQVAEQLSSIVEDCRRLSMVETLEMEKNSNQNENTHENVDENLVKGEETDNVLNRGDQSKENFINDLKVVDQSSEDCNESLNSVSICEVNETKSFPDNQLLESSEIGYSQKPVTSNQIQHRLSKNELENNGEKFDNVTFVCSKLDSDPALPNCDKLLVKLSTDFPDNHPQTSGVGRVVCKGSTTRVCLIDETSEKDVSRVQGSSLQDNSLDNICLKGGNVCSVEVASSEDLSISSSCTKNEDVNIIGGLTYEVHSMDHSSAINSSCSREENYNNVEESSSNDYLMNHSSSMNSSSSRNENNVEGLNISHHSILNYESTTENVPCDEGLNSGNEYLSSLEVNINNVGGFRSEDDNSMSNVENVNIVGGIYSDNDHLMSKVENVDRVDGFNSVDDNAMVKSNSRQEIVASFEGLNSSNDINSTNNLNDVVGFEQNVTSSEGLDSRNDINSTNNSNNIERFEQTVTSFEGLNSGDDNSTNNSSDIEVSVCISMKKNDLRLSNDEKSTGVSDYEDSIQDEEIMKEDSDEEGSRTNEVKYEQSRDEKIYEVENLCPENYNGGVVNEGNMEADPGIENLPKIIVESVEEENFEEIYESSSDGEDDSDEPLTVMERIDFSGEENTEKSGGNGGESYGESVKSGEELQPAESQASVRGTAEMLDKTKEHLVNAEKRAEKQMAELKTELEDSEKEMFRMRNQVQDLQRESIAKSGGMERLQAELSAAYKDSEFVRRKLKRLEEELANFKQKNDDLTEELSKKAEIENENDYWKVMELENEAKELTRRVKELEALLSATRAERDDLKKRVDELLAESEEVRRVAQEALDEAMAEKIAMQEKYEREFEKLRSANIDREQKMLDDFEWKLREVEQACKRRLDDKEQTSKQLVREVEGKLTVAEGKLAQLPHLKQCEQELNHLRERSIETQRSLRTATRQLELLQDSDKQQHEEIQQLKQLLEKEKSHLTTVQSIHYRELGEKDRKLQFKLDQQKTEINSEWEDKLRRETQRIKTESDRHHRTEKLQALDEAKLQHQQKLKELESSWEKKHVACVKEIDSLKTKLSEKEDYYKHEFETIQTKADQDIFDLRRKLDRIDLSYQEQIEKIQLKHEKELEKVREDADRRIQQCELNAQHQVGASRTTIELVKEQMQRESQQQLQKLSEHHRRQLEEQWEQLVQERDDAIAMMEQKHRSSIEKLRNELDSIYKGKNSRETELMDSLNHMRQELSGKTTQIGSLETNVEELQGNLEVLNCEVSSKAQQITKVMKEGEEVLRQRELQLQETYQSQLEEMTDRHRKEIVAWQSNVDELQKKIAALAKRDEPKDTSNAAKKIEELAKQLKEKENQIATLTKEKHLYQLELMNKDKESVQAKQRRRGGRGRHQGGRGQRS